MIPARFVRLGAVFAVCATALVAAAYAVDTKQPGAPEATPGAARPRVGLVLSGGGARGLSHIGVLQALRELRVPVDRVVGTSIGAVVGGAYAAGQPIEVIERFAVATDWGTLFNERGARRDLDYRRKRDDERLLPAPAFSVGRDGLTLPRSAFGSHLMEIELRRLSAPARDVRDLDRLPIPFRSIAADLESGALVRMRQVPLFTAMRASTAVPGAFAPIEVEGRLLVDGGIVRNLPVDIAREMGAEVLIVVNVGTPPVERDELASALSISVQMLALLIEQNVRASLAQVEPSDVLIAPSLQGFGSSQFERADELIARGRAATLAARAQLQRLALSADEYAAWEAARVRHDGAGPVRLANVTLDGLAPAEARALRERLPFRAGDTVDDAAIDGALKRLFGTGNFERIDYQLLPAPGDASQRELAITGVPRSGGPGTLRFGWSLESDFRDNSRFNVAAGYTYAPITDFGTEWRTYLQLGAQRQLEAEIYQPIGAGRDWFVAPQFAYTAFDQDVFAIDGFRERRFDVQATALELALGRRLGTIGEVRVGYARWRVRQEVLIAESIRGSQSGYQNLYSGELNIDTWDSAAFPTEGVALRYEYLRFSRQRAEEEPTFFYGFDVLKPMTWGKNTLLLGGSLRRARGPGAEVPLGGFLNLSGTPPDQLTGHRVLLLRGIFVRRIGVLPRGFGTGIYAGGSFELGAALPENQDFNYGAMKRAGSALIGFDTLVGPVFLAAGRTYQGGSAVYLFVGRI
jgi:NTE family protein